MGKKRRAAPSNPNRGFATTSTPSKAKPEPEPEKVETPVADKVEEEKPKDEEEGQNIETKDGPAQETSFEEMEVNALYGQHGPAVQRMTEKYLAKLALDQQGLKGLPTTTGIMQVETVDSILRRYRDNCAEQPRRKEKIPFATAWALWECLNGIGGFTHEEVEQGLSWWLQQGIDKTLEGGVEEVISWIYAGRKDDSEVVDKSDEAPLWHPPRQTNHTRRRRKPKRVAFQSQGQQEESESESDEDGPEEEEEEEVSEEESDDDEVDDTEESLIAKYIVLMTKLFKINPDLAPPPRPTQNKKGKKQAPQPKPANNPAAKTTKRSLKISGKITSIQRDPLFDQHNADLAWREKRIDLVQELPKPAIKDPKPPPPLDTEPGKSILKGAHKEEDDGGLLGGMFNEGAPHTPDIQEKEAIDSGIRIRDFDEEFKPKPDPKAKFKKSQNSSSNATSMPPVKFLEESIRARLGGISQVRLDDVAVTSYSNRLAVMIHSKNAHAGKYENRVLEKLGCKVYNLKKGGIRVEMVSVAAKTKSQAEWYLVTVTLWVCCRDRAPSSRLSTTWRGVWAEILEQEEDVKETRKKDVVRVVSSVLEKFTPEEAWADSSERKLAKEVTVDQDEVLREMQPLDKETVRNIWLRKCSTDRYRQMLKGRQELPMWSYRDEVLRCIKENQVTIICGETGCGKSTQVPAFILEQEMSDGKDCRIYCTEPRRISAISLARRVSEELGERKQEVGTRDSLIGYAIRLESRVTKDTRLIYATTVSVLL
ncbi:hypothetical protein BJ508DRAFT_163757 [Ascobolus immersus RN42]|uniref:Helicase ATP-binding domain-containing protein n=1 Tax=Ascobolus immersus RN42 TaxID=1160509 RepID=A0A3N4HVE6_ASCIM|nr:hypothetical protein BJ508DRAFT_163757 [Ascobolus immersus RN42]